MSRWDWPAGCGSGPGTFVKGDPVTSLEQVPVGTLIYCDGGGSPKPTVNIAEVLRVCGTESAWDREAVVCRFVDPSDPSKIRLPSDIEWLFAPRVDVVGHRSFFLAIDRNETP